MRTDRPDLSVNVPNISAPADRLCSMSSVWYFWSDIVLRWW